jgi:hypothetical protein
MYKNIDSRFGHDRAQNNEPKSARAVSIVLAKRVRVRGSLHRQCIDDRE